MMKGLHSKKTAVLEDQREVLLEVVGAEWKGWCDDRRKLRQNAGFAEPHLVLWVLSWLSPGVLGSQSS